MDLSYNKTMQIEVEKAWMARLIDAEETVSISKQKSFGHPNPHYYVVSYSRLKSGVSLSDLYELNKKVKSVGEVISKCPS